MTSPFLFAITNFGSERALKLEASLAGLDWRPGYQRKGFLTFKCGQETNPFDFPALNVPLALARRLCLSVGKFATEAAATAALSLPLIHHINLAERPNAEEAPPEPLMPAVGQQIGTVVKLSEQEFWAGIHLHANLRSPYPGGSSGVVLHPDSPSRAWLKMEEAERFFGIKLRKTDIVVELGCAPGGVLLALLQRGISSIGVDPAKLAPVVTAAGVEQLPTGTRIHASPPWVFHVRKPAALVAKRDLAVPVTWFMSDMNQSPTVAIKECGRFMKMCPSIRHALITLKLTDLEQIRDKPEWTAMLKSFGFRNIRFQQLSVHHHEICVWAGF
jgi:hypothetical protein